MSLTQIKYSVLFSGNIMLPKKSR